MVEFNTEARILNSMLNKSVPINLTGDDVKINVKLADQNNRVL